MLCAWVNTLSILQKLIFTNFQLLIRILMSKRRKQVILILRKLLIALGVALLFSFLGLFSGLGYYGEASTRTLDKDRMGFWLVEANCNISFNPFLYPFSWLSGKGYFSESFQFLSVPTYVGFDVKYPAWRSTEELNEEAILRVIMNSVVVNIPSNFFMLLAIGIMEQQLLYLCVFGGIIGFLIGQVLGSVLGLIAVIFIAYYLMPKLNILDSIKRFFD